MVPPTGSGDCHSAITHYALQCSTEKTRQDKTREEKRREYFTAGKESAVLCFNRTISVCCV